MEECNRQCQTAYRQGRKDATEAVEGLKDLGKLYSEIRAEAIEEYRKEMHAIIEGNEEFTDWQKHEILECNELVAEQLKETFNDEGRHSEIRKTT